MAKKEKKNIPDGMKCFRKINGGSIRFPNRIIKSGQKFWAIPNDIPKAFNDQIEETSEDYKAIIVPSRNGEAKAEKMEVPVSPEYDLAKAKDDNGEVIKRGKNPLWNVVSNSGTVMNEEPLTKGKAKEFVKTLNS